jgi:hypothetical protein
VKSPVASLCLACSSVKNRVRVTMFVLTVADSAGGIWCPFPPLEAMLKARSELSAACEGKLGALEQCKW